MQRPRSASVLKSSPDGGKVTFRVRSKGVKECSRVRRSR